MSPAPAPLIAAGICLLFVWFMIGDTLPPTA